MLQSDASVVALVVEGSQPSALQLLGAHVLNSSADKWAIDYLHRADGNRCPFCQAPIEGDGRLRRWYQGQRIKCSCGRFFTSLTGSMLAGSTLDPGEFFLLYALLELQLPPEKIAAIIPINKETVTRWRKRLNIQEPSSV